MSKQHKEYEKVETTNEEKVETTNEEKVETTNEEKVETTNEEKVEDEDDVILDGRVVDCFFLRVRKHPSTDDQEICIIKKGEKVLINIKESTDDFYKIQTTGNKIIKGYCMKQFIQKM